MTSADPRAARLADMSRAVLAAVTASKAALEAINTALATTAGDVSAFGLHHLMACRGPLSALIDENGPAVVLARNELVALGQEVPPS